MIRRLRRDLWTRVVAGKILEIGAGTGENFEHHPAGAEVTGVDLSPRMLARAQRRVALSKARLEIREADVQNLPFSDDCFDTAVATFVFCSVPDPARGLRELARVIRPGGRILLLEHVRIDLPIFGMMMDFADPLAVRISGAHMNRRTGRLVQSVMSNVVEERRGPLGMIRLIEIGVE
ncbi:MAG: class I SAM-dependent methyltransferase [Chloroflexi bacterium]|nr:class I SAM-dependent methyltransferase [Chloroflexota bacterium]